MRKYTGPKRRNTLTLDNDNAVRLERLRSERNLSFKDVVNDVPAQPFRTKALKAGKPNFTTPEQLKELMQRIQEEEDFAMLTRSGFE
jgi:hypothetical protein